MQRTQPTNDKMSLYVPCLIHCGPRCHPGCCSPLWGSRVKFARRQAGFCKPFVGPAHCWTVQADLWWDLILSKGVSYSAQRDRAICFAKGDADSQSQRRHSSCWLLTLLVTKLRSSMLSLKLKLGGAQAATVAPPSFSQVTLVCSSETTEDQLCVCWRCSCHAPWCVLPLANFTVSFHI